MNICNVPECQRPARAQGWCANHYSSRRKGKICKLDGCDKTAIGLGYCSKHYQQVKQFGEVRSATERTPRPAIIDGVVARIPLGINAKDGYTIVDVENNKLDKYKWVKHKHGYAVANISGKSVKMHQLITTVPVGMVIDHINNDRLDNRLFNLRPATSIQNSRNSIKPKNNTTGYKGVTFAPRDGRYVARIGYEMKRVHIGRFQTPEQAAQAYNTKALELYGEFAKLNTIK